MAVGIERFWPGDSTGGILVRVKYDLGVDKGPGGDSLIQSLAKSSSCRHARGELRGSGVRDESKLYGAVSFSAPKTAPKRVKITR